MAAVIRGADGRGLRGDPLAPQRASARYGSRLVVRLPRASISQRPVTAPCEDSLHHRLSLGEVLLPRGRVRHRRDVSEVAFAFAWLTARLPAGQRGMKHSMLLHGRGIGMYQNMAAACIFSGMPK